MARHRLAGEARARAIARAAMRLFARRGFSGVTSRQIARAAGVSEGLVFKHFPRKDSLYRAILQEKIHETETAAPSEASLRLADDETFLIRIAADVIGRVDHDDTFLRLLLHSALEGHPLAEEFRRARVEQVRAMIERRIRRRFARRRWSAPVDPALAARVFSGMIQAALINRRVLREPAIRRVQAERWARLIARIFLHGLEPREEAP